MHSKIDRRGFLRKSAVTGLTLGLGSAAFGLASKTQQKEIRIGMIGLDTSHSIAFTELINDPGNPAAEGYRVTVAYPYGSRTIESSYSRIPGYTEDIKKLGVEIAPSVRSLLDAVDVVMLETNDGNLHLEQSVEVFKAGKTLFIDKPVAGNLRDAIAIYEAAEKYNVPVFSSSSLRWSRNSYQLRNGELIGRILGADTYSPAMIEPSHADLYWYGVHGVESLFTVMGTGCREVVRVHNPDTDIVVGTWHDGRLGTFRGKRTGRRGFGGTAFGETGISEIGPYDGYGPIIGEIINFFRTGTPPVSKEETIEIFAFMEAADESRRNDGRAVQIESVLKKAGYRK
jgi:hypothetical protein